MHIEQSFRDDKSGSFDLEATKLTDPERLHHLLLAIAVATLWIYDVGEQVLRAQERSEIDPAFKRQLSVFQIGWRKLRRWITCQTLNAAVPNLTAQPLPPRSGLAKVKVVATQRLISGIEYSPAPQPPSRHRAIVGARQST